MITKGYVPNNQQETLKGLIQKIIENPAAKAWFEPGWQVKNEAEIISKSGEILRPDRVMIQNQKAVVVDYKTGKVNDRYRSQLRKYIRALEEMGYQSVEGYLYYLNQGLVEQV